MLRTSIVALGLATTACVADEPPRGAAKGGAVDGSALATVEAVLVPIDVPVEPVDPVDPGPRFDFGPAEPPLPLAAGSTIIVYPPTATNATELYSIATLLRDQLRRVTGEVGGFGVFPDQDPLPVAAHQIIAIGDTRWARPAWQDQLWRDGYVIDRQHAGAYDVVTIAGGTRGRELQPGYERGSVYGTLAFMDRQLGVRFYMPRDAQRADPWLWASAPTPTAVTLPDLGEWSEPQFRSLWATGYNQDHGLDGLQWARNNAVDNRRLGGTHQHSVGAIFPHARFGATHPTIYPTYTAGGPRYVPTSPTDQYWQPCFSQAATLDAAVQTVTEAFAVAPSPGYVAVSINDFGAPCPDDIAGVPAAQQARVYSDVYWTFMNKLAAKVRAAGWGDRQLVGLAYTPLTITPVHFDLDPMVVPFVVAQPAELEADEAAGYYPAQLDGWSHRASTIGLHFWANGDGFGIARTFTGYLQEYLQRMVEGPAEARYAHVEAYANWGLDGARDFIMARLLWDPYVDVDALRRQYAMDMFGAAGDDMDTYGQTLEALWRQLDNVEEERKPAVSNQPRRSQHQVRTTATSRDLIAKLSDLIAAAGARDLSPAQRERWTIIANGWRMSAYLFELGQRCEAGAERTALADEALAFWRTTIAPEDFAMYRDRVIGGVDVGSVPIMIGHLRGAWIP